MNSSHPAFQNIDEYIAAFEGETRAKLEVIRKLIQQEAPKAREAIKYRMPTFTLVGNLVHFAAFKKHLSIFAASPAMLEEIPGLDAYTTEKGTIQFPLDQPLPLEIIRKVVRFRMLEDAGRR